MVKRVDKLRRRPITLLFGLSLAIAAPITSSAAPAKGSESSASTAFELSDQYHPCDDFDDYVNAKWVAANPIPPDRTIWGAFYELKQRSLDQQHQILESLLKSIAASEPGSIEQKLGRFYASGMDEAAIERAGYDPLNARLAVIARLSSWTELVNFIDSSFAGGNPYVFEFRSGADWHDAQMQIGYVSQAGLGLPTKDYYFEPRYQSIREAYVAYVAKSLELTGISRSDAGMQAREVMALETGLAKASLTPTEARSLDNQYHFVTVVEADKVSPHFSWARFFAAQGVHVERGFSLSQPGFIAEFDRLLAEAPMAQWRAYLRVTAIRNASPVLGRAFRDNYFDFYGRVLKGQPQQEARWNQVLEAVDTSMGMALGELYVARYFPPATKARIEELVANIRDALRQHIESADWMSAATKSKALEKWRAFLPKIGYPAKNEWRDWSALTVTPDSYFANVEAAAKFNYHYDVEKIGRKTDRQEWRMTPQTVDAYYDPTTNTINFPAAFLQPPFFFAKGDDAINYGGIGAVIGHESSHGFDDRGSQYDGEGNRVNWWTREDRANFDARTKLLVEQVNAYRPIKDRPDLHVNGQLTLGENIADLGGVSIAYDALQVALRKNPQEATERIQGLTEEQRFFLSWTRGWSGGARERALELQLNVDQHSPSNIRAIAPLTNMPAFARAFHCQPGDTMMRPPDRVVKIW
jgi:putative endopeptidase